MKLIELLGAIGANPKGDGKIQICQPGRNWEDYDEVNIGSELLIPFWDFSVQRLSAIETDMIRVDLGF